MIGLVWAQAANGVIGRDGAIPWRVPEDQARFRDLTLGAAVVMGRRTWESLPERYRPLPGRRNVVLTRRERWRADGAEPASSLDEALALAGDDDVWVIGGASLYAEGLGRASLLHVTELADAVDGDVMAPAVGPEWRVADVDPAHGWHTSTSGARYRFVTRRR